MSLAALLAKDGAARLDRAALAFLPAVEAALADLAPDKAGIRLWDRPPLAALLHGAIGEIARALLPGGQPVRALLFNKTAETNWALGWHQDRTIAVRARHDVPGFGAWTVKAGTLHVEPPFALIERMVTLRVHLDPVDADNAPLLVALATHRLGRIEDSAIAATVAGAMTIACTAEAGDVWAYATPILHASDVARSPRARRVLQVDYSASTLPPPLAWRGI